MIPIENSYSFPNCPGIYKFTNKLNGKVYIGESLYMKDRMSTYRTSIKNPICIIERALAKYSFDGFDLSVLELFPNGTQKPVLLAREKFWISFYDSTNKNLGYNKVAVGTDMTGYKMSDETKGKISKANKGRRFSDESKKRMSAGQIGKKVSNAHLIGVPLSESHRKNVGDSLRGKTHPEWGRLIYQRDKDGNLIKTWRSISEAASSGMFKNKRSGIYLISRVLRGEKKTTRGFKWEYASPPKFAHHSK